MGGGSGQQQSSVQTTVPWYGQQPFLQNAFNEAQDIYNTQKAQNTPGYQGEFVAQTPQGAINNYEQALNFAGGTGAQAVNNQLGASAGLTAQGQLGLGASMGGLYGIANGDPTQQQIDQANQYAAGVDVPGLVDAAMRDANRNFSENVLPGIDRDGAATGNLNSTRGGIAQGIAQRGLQEQAADLSSQIRSQAYQQGLGLAQNNSAQQLQALQGLGSLAGGAASTGLTGTNGAIDNSKTLLGETVLGDTQLQGAQQNAINNDIAAYNWSQALPWQNLMNYWGVVGDKSWGGTTTGIQTSQNNPSALSTIGSLAAVFGSLF